MIGACFAGMSAWQVGAAIAALVYVAYIAGHAVGFEKGRKVW